MDLAYLSDAFSHLSMRGAYGAYGRYDQPWARGWMPEDRGLTVAEKHRQANRQKKVQQKKQGQPCPICRESKRRKLGSYIRQKSQDSADVLVEEDEEHAEHAGHAGHAEGPRKDAATATTTTTKPSTDTQD